MGIRFRHILFFIFASTIFLFYPTGTVLAWFSQTNQTDLFVDMGNFKIGVMFTDVLSQTNEQADNDIKKMLISNQGTVTAFVKVSEGDICNELADTSGEPLEVQNIVSTTITPLTQPTVQGVKWYKNDKEQGIYYAVLEPNAVAECLLKMDINDSYLGQPPSGQTVKISGNIHAVQNQPEAIQWKFNITYDQLVPMT